MLRTSIARNSGGYREEFDAIQEDLELFSRILSRHSGANLPFPVIKYRIRRSSAVSDNRHLMPKRVELVKRQFDRMNAGGSELSHEELMELQASDKIARRRKAERKLLTVSADSQYYARVGRAALRGRKLRCHGMMAPPAGRHRIEPEPGLERT